MIHLAEDMENPDTCEVCAFPHKLSCDWPGCACQRLHFLCAGSRNVQEWRDRTTKAYHDFPAFQAATEVLPCVLARVLDARADPNLGERAHHCDVPDFMVHKMKTPLHEVLERLQHGLGRLRDSAEAVQDCVKLLVQHKADLSLVDAWERTPLQVVLQYRRVGIHFAEGPERRVIELAEQCVDIRGGEARCF